MALQQKISKAKAKLLVEYPAFGTIASKLEMVLNDNIESFKSNGIRLEYREAYLAACSLDEIAFILANGAMHATLAHEQRRSKRSGWLWQMATDIAINDMLLANGMQMPYGAQYTKRFAGMYAEEIYAELKSDIVRDDEDLEYEAEDLDDCEVNDPPKSEEIDDIVSEQLFAQEAQSLLEAALERGEMVAGLDRLVTLQKKGEHDWRSHLRDALEPYFYDDYRMLPPSKKLLYEGIYLPSTTSQTFHLSIGIDSSGSVDRVLLDRFLGEILFILEHLGNYIVDLIVCDDRVREYARFYTGEMLEYSSIEGGGATDFRPLFEYVTALESMPKVLIYFTDLEGIFPVQEPDFRVIWVTPKEKEIPFGEILLLEEE